MKIKLLKDVLQNGQVKTTVKPRKKAVIGWFAGVEMEVSDATGEKLIDAGDAEAVESAEVETEE